MLKKTTIVSLSYVSSLDVIRALAVFMVMLLHAHFPLGKGGGLGVDIFFALSGFLITTLLLEEFRKYNSISLSSFYIRRTFRLFPALYFMLFVVLIYATF